jgi:hypothetical protein
MSSEWATRLKQCSDEAVEFRKWITNIFPDTFPKGNTTDFDVVFAEAKALIIKYSNLKSLMEK